MKKCFLIFSILFVFIFQGVSCAYKITTVGPAGYYAPGYYNNYYYGRGYGYPPPPPPPPQLVPNIPYNRSTYYNYYNRMPPMPTPLISKSNIGKTSVVLPYGYSSYYTPSVRNYGTTTVRQYYSPSSTRTNSQIIRYYY